MERKFVEWKEQFVSQERGNRVVHYYVKDGEGNSFLAIVGTERSLRHMVYVVSDEFLQMIGVDKSGSSSSSSMKWRSRREVVDWLSSLLGDRKGLMAGSPPSSMLRKLESPPPRSFNEFNIFPRNGKGHAVMKLKGCHGDIVWMGNCRTCTRQLKHYVSFYRNGTTVEVNSFVFVMSREDVQYLAYLEDMFEDRKGKKKVKVRWFHQCHEVTGKILPPNLHPKEVFITPYVQIISAESVNGVAYVLTPEHYDICLAANIPHISAQAHICFREFSSNGIFLFDTSALKGYFKQKILSHINPSHVRTSSMFRRTINFGHHQFLANQYGGLVKSTITCNSTSRNLRVCTPGRHALGMMNVEHEHVYFKVDDKVELLCQDSGIRGCWFRCTVLELARNQVKVRYDDLRDENEDKNLEEWVPAFRLAAPDKLGMRHSGRFTIRPCPAGDELSDVTLMIGVPVDVWWNDGWWEGVITSTDDSMGGASQVFFPGEDEFSFFQKENLRVSKDWVENQWLDIEIKSDILSAISSISPSTKFSACFGAEAKRNDSCEINLLDRSVSDFVNARVKSEPAETILSNPNESSILEDSKQHDGCEEKLVPKLDSSLCGVTGKEYECGADDNGKRMKLEHGGGTVERNLLVAVQLSY